MYSSLLNKKMGYLNTYQIRSRSVLNGFLKQKCSSMTRIHWKDDYRLLKAHLHDTTIVVYDSYPGVI